MHLTLNKNIFIKILLLFLLILPLSVSAQHKRALVIGLGEQEDKSWNEINGDKDVKLVRSLLTRAGFTDVQYLVNSRATKKNILNSFDKITRRCCIGDVVYIHFSGHGQQMNDFDNDEYDSFDECWIPYDAYKKCCARDNGSRHITDDEINNMLHRIKSKIGDEGKLLVIVDACHSGDSSRGNDTETYRGSREMFYASDELCTHKRSSFKEDWIILSACRDFQRNAEIKTPEGQFGKLTYALYKLLGEQKSYSNDQLYRDLCRFFDRHRGVLQQTPILKGVTDNFRITDVL